MLQVTAILRYLGEHVTLLTSMNLRDYLYLKVLWSRAAACIRPACVWMYATICTRSNR